MCHRYVASLVGLARSSIYCPLTFRFPNTCRTLYDCDEQEEFLESLSGRIKEHEKEIERMCNKNYQWFIESVSELHKVKSEANKIKVCLPKLCFMGRLLIDVYQQFMRNLSFG